MPYTGQVFDQKRRVVVRRDPVGDPAFGQVPAIRRVCGPSGSGEPVAHARGRRPVRVPAAAGVQPGHLRPDARVLETAGVGEAHFPGDSPVPAAQKPGLRARRVMTVERRQRQQQQQQTVIRTRGQTLALRAPGKRVVPTSQGHQLTDHRLLPTNYHRRRPFATLFST